MAIKSKRSALDAGNLINVTPVVDLMFTLIIFFMTTTVFKEIERDIQVNLPTDSSQETLSSSDKVIVINVRKSGAYIMADKQVNADEMVLLIAEAVKKNPGQKVLVRADQEALHGYVARAVGACRHAGVNQANIGYQVPSR